MSKESKFISAMLHSDAQPTKEQYRTCAKCGETKAITEFAKTEKDATGRRKKCKKCMRDPSVYKYWARKKEREFEAQFMPI